MLGSKLGSKFQILPSVSAELDDSGPDMSSNSPWIQAFPETSGALAGLRYQFGSLEKMMEAQLQKMNECVGPWPLQDVL